MHFSESNSDKSGSGTTNATTFNSVTIGSTSGSWGYAQTQKLFNLDLSEELQSITTVDYTVKFQDALGNTLKDDVVHDNGVVGEIYQATPEDMATFYNDGETAKYVYKSGQNTETLASTIASSNVIILVFDVYEKTEYTVKAQVSGSDLTTLASGTAYLDGSISEYWNKYINVSDSWYVADDDTYGTAITAASINVAFTATDIDYFFEFEDMTISRSYNAYNGTSASNGQAKTLYGDANAKTTTKAAAGVYTICVNGIKWQDGYADNYEIAYSADGTNWIALGNISYADGEEGVKTLAGAIIPTASYIRIWTTQGSQTPRRYLDYLALEKTADLPTSVSATMGTNGFATFSSAYNLDLANLPAGVKAYTATLSESTLSFTECTKAVPAATGLLLAGDASTSYDIPVTAEAADAVAGNALIAAVTATSKQSTVGGMYYFVMKAGSDPLAFAPISTEKAVTIPAGKAYVELNTASGARSLTVTFGDETTGIQTVANIENATENYYNLSGQRVANPAKGLYIVNGKKVIIK